MQTVLEYRVEQLLDPVRKLDATTLKWIAMLAMVCDHFALTILMRGARFGWITPENPTALNLPYQAALEGSPSPFLPILLWRDSCTQETGGNIC